MALKGESSDFFLHYLLPHIPFAADAITKCKVCSTVQCRKSKWKTAERTKLLCLPHTHTHYWWVQKASVPYFSLCIGDNLDLDDCLGMSWACFPGIVRHILMLVGEILHLEKKVSFSHWVTSCLMSFLCMTLFTLTCIWMTTFGVCVSLPLMSMHCAL